MSEVNSKIFIISPEPWGKWSQFDYSNCWDPSLQTATKNPEETQTFYVVHDLPKVSKSLENPTDGFKSRGV